MAAPALMHDSESWIMKEKDKSKLQPLRNEIFFRKVRGCMGRDLIQNEDIREELRTRGCVFVRLFRSSASSFSSQHLLQFLKSSRSYVLLLPTPSFPSSVLQCHHEGGNLFSEYDRSN